MTEIIKKEREEKAVFLNNALKAGLLMRRRGSFISCMTLYKIDKDELFLELGYESIDQFCSEPGIDLQVGTAKKYIHIGEKVDELFKKKIFKDVDLDGLSIGKIQLIINYKKPKELIEAAKRMPYSDFRKTILEKQGVDVKDDEVKKYINRQNCPHWNKDGCMKSGKWCAV